MTPEEEPFIAALVADPEDETTRLVYSDWLEERGEEARAAYLRAEAACYRVPEDRRDFDWCDMPGVDPVWAAMVSRTGVLVPGLTFTYTGPKVTRADLKAIEDHWGQPLPPDYAAFLLLYNGGSPSKPYLWSYLDDDDFYDEVRFFSTRDTHPDGRPALMTNAATLLGGRCRDPREEKSLAGTIPIGTLTYSFNDEEEDEENLLGLILDPLGPFAPRVVKLENSARHGVRSAVDDVHAKDSFVELLHSLVNGR